MMRYAQVEAAKRHPEFSAESEMFNSQCPAKKQDTQTEELCCRATVALLRCLRAVCSLGCDSAISLSQ